MTNTGKHPMSLPGGIRPHSCRCCRNIIIRCGEVTEYGQEIVQSQHNLKRVSEMSNSGCFLFRGRLQVLLSNLSTMPTLDGTCREICGASVAGRLQVFYPLSPFWKLKKMNCWKLEVRWSVGSVSNSLDFYWKDQHGAELCPPEELRLFATKDSGLQEKITDLPLQPTISLSMSQGWLQECQFAHSECNELAQNALTGIGPKRLMYVGSANKSIARIQNVKDESRKQYAALSYCWGDASKNTFKTTKETLASRLHGFSIAELPKTLQDAIEVTRTLELEYLWVDVLCIVQDSEKDMDAEISRMWRIYRNATITISASRASHSAEGFLHPRDLETTDENTFAIRWCDLDNSDPSKEQLAFYSEVDIRRCYHDPIDTRAWTMQEHNLSSRHLRFGKSQMVWRCSQGIRVDGGSEDEEPPDYSIGEKTHAAIYSWQQDVSQFTARFITKMDDRLLAVAAMAEDYAPKIGAKPSDYLAGLWKQGLPFMLLWRIKDKDASRTYLEMSSDKGLLPTWSWHAARSGVCWPEFEPALHSDRMSLEVLSHDVTLENDTFRYGKVKSASLTVLGVLSRVIWSKNGGEWITYDHARTTSQVDITWDSDTKHSEQKLYCLDVRRVGFAEYEGLVIVQGGESFSRVGYHKRKGKQYVSAASLDRRTPRQLQLV